MYVDYYDDWKVRSEFQKEFICVFDGWLGKENLHKLDEVSPSDWEKFNDLVFHISEKYRVQLVNTLARSVEEVANLKATLSTYDEYMQGEDFTQYILPDLDCVLAQHWDFTWILWHKNNGAVEEIAPMAKAVGLYSFHD